MQEANLTSGPMKPTLTARGLFFAFLLLCSVTAEAQTIYSSYAISSLAGTNGVLFYNTPYDVAAGPDGALYVAATYDYTIWKLTKNSSNSLWTSTAWAGSSGNPGTNDGVGGAARFTYPQCVAVDSNNNVYVGDSGNRLIREITPDGNVTTIARGQMLVTAQD